MKMNYYELVGNRLVPIITETNEKAIEDYRTQCAIYKYINLGFGRYVKQENGKVYVLIIDS